MKISELTALQLGAKIQGGEISVKEAVQAALERAKAAEPVINSYVTLDEEGAYAQAEEIQKKIDAGELTGPLAGVPVAVKDNMCIKGQLTTCSSKILSNFKPTYTAEAVENLRKAGMVILGKRIWMSSPWEARQKLPGMAPPGILTIQPMCPAVHRGAPVRLWRRESASVRWDQIPGDRSASQVPTAAW